MVTPKNCKLGLFHGSFRCESNDQPEDFVSDIVALSFWELLYLNSFQKHWRRNHGHEIGNAPCLIFISLVANTSTFLEKEINMVQ